MGTSGHLRLVGVEGYEGLLAPDRSPEALAKVDSYLDRLRRLTVRLADARAFSVDGPILVSAGGSRFFDRVALVLGDRARYGGHDVSLVVRSGCYAVHDHGTYAHASPLDGPDYRRAPAHGGDRGLGRRAVGARAWSHYRRTGPADVSYDLGLPVTLRVARMDSGSVEPLGGMALSQLNDQHGYLRAPPGPAPAKVGDRIGFGISHPCTAIDKWRTVFLVGDDYQIRDEIHTFFH